jgi:hypothetical protein
MLFEPFGQLPVSDIGPRQLALRNRFARSSQEGDFVAIVILPYSKNIYHIRYFPVDNHIIYDNLLSYKGVGRHEPPFS